MINQYFGSLEAFRPDGRSPLQHRHSLLTFPSSSTDSYILLAQGLSKVMAKVQILNEPSKDEQVLFINICQSPSSGFDRKGAQEGQRQLRCFMQKVISTFHNSILLQSYKTRRIQADLFVLVNDGAIKSLAVNALSLALADYGVLMKELVVAIQCCYDNKLIVDPTLDQSKQASSHLTTIFFQDKIQFLDHEGERMNQQSLRQALQKMQIVHRGQKLILEQQLRSRALKLSGLDEM